MPPKKSSNAAKPSSKKNAAAAATTTTTNDCMASAPFSPFVLISYKMVRYSLSNGDSFAEVLLSGSGFSDVDDFEFDLVQDGGALSFTHAIPPTFKHLPTILPLPKPSERASGTTVVLCSMPTLHARFTPISSTTSMPKAHSSASHRLSYLRGSVSVLWTTQGSSCLPGKPSASMESSTISS